METYRSLLDRLERYFQRSDWKQLFLSGGCYWLADWLHQRIPFSVIMINRRTQHCALFFHHGLYDVTGRISEKNFYPVTQRDLAYMRKHYKPPFDAEALEAFLIRMEGETAPIGEGAEKQ